ncbi:MAG: hypothetical protein JNK67_08855 [Alphaproteobacteria bacterium]|nr:hypothetical protein [Alphaproteobacteria bacterium]
MIRLLVEFVVPLLLPTALYGLWVAWASRRAAAANEEATATWRNAPWLLLGGLGIALAIVAVIGSGLGNGGGDIRGTYVPPKVVDGKVVPGHVDPAKPK